MQTPFLIGDRLYLRPLGEADLGLCMTWINDPELIVFLDRRLPMGLEQERSWLKNQYGDPSSFSLAIVLKDGDMHIGNCGLHRINRFDRSAEFGIMIGDPESREKGYGTEAGRLLIDYAFHELNLHRVGLRVFSFNKRAQAMYEKLGFVLEGIERESYFRHGGFHDTLMMAILDSEWSET
ncbi:GNAT family N-acetyltransferase [Candidatus Bipolaricaulota bacterium]|nr:GNAT family N-acetyltransferase [Candidatus Bipolaricaulota bacterium]